MKRIFLSLIFQLIFVTLLYAQNLILEEEAATYNKQLPKRIGADVVLEKLVYESKIGFKYTYTLEGVETAEKINIVSAKLISQTDEILYDNCKDLPEFFQVGLISDNTPLIFSYKTIDGRVICDIVIDLKKCENFDFDEE